MRAVHPEEAQAALWDPGSAECPVPDMAMRAQGWGRTAAGMARDGQGSHSSSENSCCTEEGFGTGDYTR